MGHTETLTDAPWPFALFIFFFFWVNKQEFSMSHFLFCHSRVEQRVGKLCSLALHLLSSGQATDQSCLLTIVEHPWQWGVPPCVPSPRSRAEQGSWWRQRGPGESTVPLPSGEGDAERSPAPPACCYPCESSLRCLGRGYQRWVNTARLVLPSSLPARQLLTSRQLRSHHGTASGRGMGPSCGWHPLCWGWGSALPQDPSPGTAREVEGGQELSTVEATLHVRGGCVRSSRVRVLS